MNGLTDGVHLFSFVVNVVVVVSFPTSQAAPFLHSSFHLYTFAGPCRCSHATPRYSSAHSLRFLLLFIPFHLFKAYFINLTFVLLSTASVSNHLHAEF